MVRADNFESEDFVVRKWGFRDQDNFKNQNNSNFENNFENRNFENNCWEPVFG